MADASSLASLLGDRPRLIPVLHVENANHAEPLLAALIESGIAAIEVTLRSAAALTVIERMVRAGSKAIVGAGTVTRTEQFAQVASAGGRFAFGPAITPRLADAARASGVPFIPGVATPSEALLARESGFTELKFFPAELMGGLGWLTHLRPIFPELRFCPTAGVGPDNLRAYLDLSNVFAVGGAFLAPRDLIEAEDWSEIRRRASDAVRRATA